MLIRQKSGMHAPCMLDLIIFVKSRMIMNRTVLYSINDRVYIQGEPTPPKSRVRNVGVRDGVATVARGNRTRRLQATDYN
jgi:hypothetical protein